MRFLRWLTPGDDEPFWVRNTPTIISNTIALVTVYTFICYVSSTSVQSHWREMAVTAIIMFASGTMGSEIWHRWHRAKRGEKL